MKLKEMNSFWISLFIFILTITCYLNTGIAAENDKIPTPPTELKITSEPVPPPTVPPPTVSPTGNSSMLVGMTPAKYQIPSGWTLLRTQDFEGSQPSGEYWKGGSASTTNPHSGSKSFRGRYSNDQADISWVLDGSVVGSLNEVYLSFYEYIDPAALFNDEYFQFRFSINDGAGFQEVVGDWVWVYDINGNYSYNQPRAEFYVWPQGMYGISGPMRRDVIPKGAWHQWEIHFRPNTVGSANGFIRIYLDGSIYLSKDPGELVGRNMNGMDVQAGGVYTMNVWMRNSPTCTECGTFIGDGTDFCGFDCSGAGPTKCPNGNYIGQPFSNPICQPPIASWTREIDDIIVMKK